MLDNVSFAFVMNLLDVRCSMPFRIFENCYFQKATAKQIELIRGFLIKTESRVIDFTIKNQLQKLAKHLDTVLEI